MSTITDSPNVTRVWKLFKYCQTVFGSNKVNIDFPKGTKPENTYKWRYLVAYLERMDEWEITEDIAYRIIDELVKLAVKRKLLKKGLALLNANNLILESYQIAKEVDESNDSNINRLKLENKLVITGDLLGKDDSKSLPNIAKWYMRGDLSLMYIACSIKCNNAIAKLDKLDKAVLPNWQELVYTRMAVNKDVKLRKRIMSILGGDFRSI